jgi:hypothetical protein
VVTVVHAQYMKSSDMATARLDATQPTGPVRRRRGPSSASAISLAASMREGSINSSATAAVSARGYRKVNVIANSLILWEPDPSLAN